MNTCQSIIRDLQNCDDDHIGRARIKLAREELMKFLSCDDFDLDMFLKFFVIVEQEEVRISVRE